MPSLALSLVLPLAAALLVSGCAARGSAEDGAVADAATRFLATAGTTPDAACDLLAPATRETLSADGQACADALADADPGSEVDSTEPRIDVYGRDAMVRWGAQTLFLARFDDGWLVTAAGCEPRGEDLPYDCTVEGR
jgi:hypothetical protein